MQVDMPVVQVSIKTADNLRTVAQLSRLSVPVVSRLSLPEMEAVVDQVARLAPAGNIPGLILSGLVRLPERRLPAPTIRRDLNLLFQGVEQTLDKAIYATFFAGPAAVIAAYQGLLKLAGKDPAEAFPEGTWQFYAEYALREDTARHANETYGFDSFLRRNQFYLSPVHRVAAWTLAGISCLHQYESLLANEWRERVYTHLLAEVTRHRPDAADYASLYSRWEKQRPYGRDKNGLSRQPYPAYRRHCFDRFLAGALAGLDADERSEWQQRVDRAEAEDLPAYQHQMSILAYLDPGPYGETRTPIPLAQAAVGLIHRGAYYLIPACLPGSDRPPDVPAVRSMVAAAFVEAGCGEQACLPPALARVRRAAWPDLRPKLAPGLVQELDRLRQAPIWFNSDQRSRHLPLAELRQAARGRGDHALTLFDTGETLVFDQSHIFFDGAWGAALAEILTQEAIYWAHLLQASAEPVPPVYRRPQTLAFTLRASDLALFARAPQAATEMEVETDAVDLKAILRLRRLFKQRNHSLQLTVNDLLLLYRAVHAVTYRPQPELARELEQMLENSATRPVANAALGVVESAGRTNPTIVVPFDASLAAPRERLYPITIQVPLAELDFLGLHQAAWTAYQQVRAGRSRAGNEFDRLRREYLATLAGFGQLLNRAKQIARAGESLSVAAIKLLAHIPVPLQRLLEKVPDSFDLLNDLLKGREVLSNLGAVAPGSTLVRFISAKDDNDNKTLVWGVMTTAQGVMKISLRDFRPHVGPLVACGRQDLAVRLAQDYLDAYAGGLNRYVHELYEMTAARRGLEE